MKRFGVTGRLYRPKSYAKIAHVATGERFALPPAPAAIYTACGLTMEKAMEVQPGDYKLCSNCERDRRNLRHR